MKRKKGVPAPPRPPLPNGREWYMIRKTGVPRPPIRRGGSKTRPPL